MSISMDTDVIQPFITFLQTIYTTQTIIVDRPNTRRPQKPYISINVSTPIQKLGHTDPTQHVNDSNFNIGGQRSFVMSVKAYVDKNQQDFFDAQDLLLQLQDALEDPIKRETLDQAGLAPWEVGDILDVTELVETGYEPRAQIDITMGIVSNREADFGAIETVEITPTIEGEEEDKIIVSDS